MCPVAADAAAMLASVQKQLKVVCRHSSSSVAVDAHGQHDSTAALKLAMMRAQVSSGVCAGHTAAARVQPHLWPGCRPAGLSKADWGREGWGELSGVVI